METPIPKTYQKLQKRDFTSGLAEIYREVLVPLGPNRLQYGPTYYVDSLKSGTIQVHTVYSLYSLFYEPSGDMVDRTWIMIAQSTKGELLGYREMTLQKDQEENRDYYLGRGEISVVARGRGIAMPLELVHFDILQRIANIEWIPIVYVVDNGNLRQLDTLEEELRKNHSRQLEVLVKQKRQEYGRWLNLYGPNGRLGFDQYEQKEFIRKPNDYLLEIPFNILDEVQIDRTNEYRLGLEGVYSFPQKVAKDSTLLRKSKQDYYEEKLLPKIGDIFKFPDNLDP